MKTSLCDLNNLGYSRATIKTTIVNKNIILS